MWVKKKENEIEKKAEERILTRKNYQLNKIAKERKISECEGKTKGEKETEQ